MEDFYSLFAYAIDEDVRKPGQDEFTSSRYAAWPAPLWQRSKRSNGIIEIADG
jgi:hypothetical protein